MTKVRYRPSRPLFTTGPLRWRASIGRHRSAGPQMMSLLCALVMLPAVVVPGGAIVDSRLDADERFREFVSTGELGEPVSTRAFVVTVLAARTAAEIGTQPGERHDTGGVWVLVRVRVMANQETRWIRYAVVHDSGGRIWHATDRIGQPLAGNNYAFDPGIPIEGEIAFEVPAEAAGDLSIRIGPEVDVRVRDIAEVRLPVEEAMVADGLAEAEPAMVAAAELAVSDPQALATAGQTGQ